MLFNCVLQRYVDVGVYVGVGVVPRKTTNGEVLAYALQLVTNVKIIAVRIRTAC